MKRLWHQLRALALLGIQALIIQPIRRIRNRGRTGESRFLAAYSSDRLLPLSIEERVGRDLFCGCINCGLCDVSCEVLSSVRRSNLVSLSAAAIAYSRSMSEYPFANLALGDLSSCDECGSCEAACPMGVPLREIIEDVRSHTVRLEEAGVVLVHSGRDPESAGEQAASGGDTVT